MAFHSHEFNYNYGISESVSSRLLMTPRSDQLGGLLVSGSLRVSNSRGRTVLETDFTIITTGQVYCQPLIFLPDLFLFSENLSFKLSIFGALFLSCEVM